METYNDLEISGSTADLIDLLDAVRNSLNKDWLLDRATAAGYATNSGKSDRELICVKTPQINDKVGLVWFGLWDNRLQVLNIVPKEQEGLSYEEYNAILDNFFKECVETHLSKFKVEVTYDTAGIDFESIAGKDTFDKLVSWENSCNPSTGNTHPMDFERWADFVITAHRSNSGLNSTLLVRWLVEERGWNEEFPITSRIGLDYEYAIHLLRENDRH